MKGVVLGVLLAGSAWAETLPLAGDMIRKAAADYRDGRTLESLRGAAIVLEEDPGNVIAKNLIWTIAKETKERRRKMTLGPKERERAVGMARDYLARRQERTAQVLAALRKVEEGEKELRSPAGLLSAMAGLDRSLPGGEAVLYGDQVQVRFSNVLRRMEEAMGKSAFAQRKDQWRAKGYLAYFRNKWDEAAVLWEKALQEDPKDAQIRGDLASLKTLIRRRDEQAELRDLISQGETYFDTGLYPQAVEAWESVLKIDPKYPGAAESLTVARVSREKAAQRKRLGAMMERASAENRAGRPLEAAETCLEALQIDPTFAPARALLKLSGKKLSLVKKTEAAPSFTAPAIKAAGPAPADRGRAEPLYRQGLLLYSDGDVAAAVKLWRQAVAFDSTFAKAREALRQGESELAILEK